MLFPVLSPALAVLPNIAHGFFTREGGVSDGLYGSLNCGIGSADVRGNVLENLGRVARHLHTTPDRLITCHQIHSATALLVDTPWTPDARPKADALVTRTRGLAIGALAADCTPVLFADPKARVVAAAHAGWKGALGGILQSTLDVMEQAGARRADIVAVVGPCISQPSYEVGPEFEMAFRAVDAAYAGYFAKPVPNGRAHFDLPRFVADRLIAAGVGAVENTSQCTYTQPNRFFSFRRTTHARDADYGRQISAISII